jgi:hypothetical protein
MILQVLDASRHCDRRPAPPAEADEERQAGQHGHGVWGEQVEAVDAGEECQG